MEPSSPGELSVMPGLFCWLWSMILCRKMVLGSKRNYDEPPLHEGGSFAKSGHGILLALSAILPQSKCGPPLECLQCAFITNKITMLVRLVRNEKSDDQAVANPNFAPAYPITSLHQFLGPLAKDRGLEIGRPRLGEW
jgi:hypothetical protein